MCFTFINVIIKFLSKYVKAYRSNSAILFRQRNTELKFFF